jgi:hypothetical protein
VRASTQCITVLPPISSRASSFPGCKHATRDPPPMAPFLCCQVPHQRRPSFPGWQDAARDPHQWRPSSPCWGAGLVGGRSGASLVGGRRHHGYASPSTPMRPLASCCPLALAAITVVLPLPFPPIHPPPPTARYCLPRQSP